jgi:hypothetical protein
MTNPSGGSRENDVKDKSLHGLLVALDMAGTIASSAILFTYAASDGSVFGGRPQQRRTRQILCGQSLQSSKRQLKSRCTSRK